MAGGNLRFLLAALCWTGLGLAAAEVMPQARAAGTPQAGSAGGEELILCGWDEVFILELSGPTDSLPRKVWSWKAVSCPGLPDSMKSRFGTTDDCKPVEGGRQILITSSENGVALVERESGRAVFYATAPNAHSADLLPGGKVAGAASHSQDGKGDRLIIFEAGLPGRELCSSPLSWCHGVVWDSQRQLLYALADSSIHIYKLLYWETDHPGIEETGKIDLPENGGHDFFPVPHGPFISLSTSGHCWLFDRDARTVSAHPELKDLRNVKCISESPRSGRLAWVQAEGENWWAERVHFANPEYTLRLPGEHLYKVRWYGGKN